MSRYRYRVSSQARATMEGPPLLDVRDLRQITEGTLVHCLWRFLREGRRAPNARIALYRIGGRELKP